MQNTERDNKKSYHAVFICNAIVSQLVPNSQSTETTPTTPKAYSNLKIEYGETQAHMGEYTEMVLKNVYYESRQNSSGLGYGTIHGSCKHRNETSGSKKSSRSAKPQMASQ